MIQFPRKATLVFLFILGLSCIRSLTSAAPSKAQYVEGEVIVTFKPSVGLPGARKALEGHSLAMATHFTLLSQWTHRQTALARGHGRSTEEIVAELQQDPAVETAEPNYLRWPTAQPPNDTSFPQQWGLSNTGQTVNGFAGAAGDDIKFVPAWRLARPSSSNVVVAVIDSGVDYRHPDLAANMWTNG